MSDLFSRVSLSNSPKQLASKTREEQFLRFCLHSDTKVMLPIRQITEVLKIQFGQIVPIPHLPAWVIGVYNWRGDILWMVNLGHLIGLESEYQQESNLSNHPVIVLSSNKEKTKIDSENNIHLGLLIDSVEDIEMCDVEAIQSASNSNITRQIQPFLQGYWLRLEGDIVLVLNGEAIITAMPRNISNTNIDNK